MTARYLIVAKDDRRVRIEVGYGLEGALPDATANRIIDETITPHFKLGDYDGGVEAGVEQMISVVNGEPLPAARPATGSTTSAALGNMLPFALVAVVVVSGCCGRCSAGCSVPSRREALPAAIVWLVSHALLLGLGVGFLAFLFALLLGATRGWSAGQGGWGGGLGAAGGLGGLGGGGRGGGFGGGRGIQRRGRRFRRRRRLGELVDAPGTPDSACCCDALAHADAVSRAPRSMPSRRPSAGRSARMPGRSASPIETALTPLHVLGELTPRARALEVFAHLRVWDTEANNGVLIYVQLADRSVEIVADRGVASRVTQSEWDAVCRMMEEHFRAGRFKAGSIAGVEAVGALLARHFPLRRRARRRRPATNCLTARLCCR